MSAMRNAWRTPLRRNPSQHQLDEALGALLPPVSRQGLSTEIIRG